MAKMREFLFWNESGQEEKTEQMSLTKAVKSIQTKFKDKIVGVEYISKKGQKISEGIKLPWGRSKKLSR
jgi:uncharacterized protein YnzC (UPF0291/DUF896 family)